MPDPLSHFDHLLADDGPAAVVVKQWLQPVGDDVIFPPTYANPIPKEKATYNIDRFADGTSVCVIDSIPSQANRIEPAFATIADGKLVPQVTVRAKVDGEDAAVNLLAAGHRAADAVVRFSDLAKDLAAAIKARGKGDSLALAKIAPTSLLFGMWDSRDSGVKVPRLINSIIRAHNVREMHRSAQFFPALDFEAAGVGKEAGSDKASTEGMAEVPATGAHGGIRATGGICRDASLNLCSLRDITTPARDEAVKLRRYVLGLGLVALTYLDAKALNLRQGCQLVAVPDKPMSRQLVNADGTRTDFAITRDDAIAYARAAAQSFFGGEPAARQATFDPKAAQASLRKEKKAGQQG